MKQHARPGVFLAAAAATALCGGCASIAPPPPLAQDTAIQPSAGAQASSVGLDPYVAFNRAIARAQATGAGTDDFAALLDHGFALVEFRCDQYFAKLGAAEQQLRFTRKQTSLTSGVVLAMLGLANATPKAIANTGSIFSFGVASMDNYEDVYLFSPDVKVVQQLVLDALGSFRDRFAAVSRKSDLTYTGAVSTLASYEAICQPHGIRELVNRSVAQSTTTAQSPTAPSPSPAASPAPPSAPAMPAPPAPSGDFRMLPRIDIKVVPR